MPLSQADGALTALFDGAARDMVLSADSTQVLVSAGRVVVVTDLASAAEVARYDLPAAGGAIDVSADGRYAVVVLRGEAAAFARIDLSSGTVSQVTLPSGAGVAYPLHDIAFLADGSVIASQLGYSRQATPQRNDAVALLRYDFDSGTVTALGTERSYATLIASDDHTRVVAIDPVATMDIYTSGEGITATYDRPHQGATQPSAADTVGAIARDGETVLGISAVVRDAALQAVARVAGAKIGDGIYGAAFSPAGDKIYLLTTYNIVVWDVAGVRIDAAYRHALTLPSSTGTYGNALQITDDGHALVVLTTSGVEKVDLTLAVPDSTMGDDVLRGSGILYGLEGNDRLIASGHAGLFGGPGDDLYIATGSHVVAVEKAGEGNDELRTDAADIIVPLNVETVRYTGTADVVIHGNVQDNRIIAGPGNDTIAVGGGTDVIDGGAGIDTVTFDPLALASRGAVTVDLRITGPQLVGKAGLKALAGIENVVGTTYDDTLTGDAGTNVLTGGWGSDRLDGGVGADTMIGSRGNDLYIVDNVGDVVEEGYASDGIDKVKSSVSFVLPDGVERLELTGNAPIRGTGNALQNAITGNDAANVLDGKGGADTLYGGGGDDILFGGDSVAYGMAPGEELLDGGAGTDTASYADAVAAVTISLALTGVQDTRGAGHDILRSIETLVGSGFDDTLTGDARANTIRGGAGDDTIAGGVGGDRLDGGAGNDTVAYADASGGVRVDLALTTAQATGGAGSDTLKGFENLTGSAYADGLKGSDEANLLLGQGGADVLEGRGGDDRLDGGAGVDRMNGGAGNDTYVIDTWRDVVSEASGDGSDSGGVDTVLASVTYSLARDPGARFVEALTLTGYDPINGAGNDLANTITGNAVDNVLSGVGGDDTLVGGLGGDTLRGGEGADVLLGGDGQDSLSGDAGDDQLDGATGNDVLTGGEGADLLLGGEGQDNLSGNAGSDRLDGGTDDDVLTGGAGRDVLTGGEGADRFVFAAGDLAATAAATDRIVDFAPGDRIALAGIDAIRATVADDPFKFVGSTAFSGVAGELRATIGTDGDTLIQGDTDGDRVADVALVLAGAHTLVATDFAL